MAVSVMSPVRGASGAMPRPAELICLALVVAQAVYLASSLLKGWWIVSPVGGVPTDFVNVWAAGRLVLQGAAAAAYDWPTHKAMEVVALGHSFDGYFGWHYPPPFLMVAGALATIPYVPAFLLWMFGTFPLYLLSLQKIIGERSGYFLAAGFPAIMMNFIAGQNGFLSTALLGGALFMLVERPILAGVLIGLLSYKPHLGLLFPVVLAASGHWRAFIVASAVAMLMALASWGAFGTGTWQAFFASIGHTSQAVLSDGSADFGKLQTAFGLVRELGGSETLARGVQATVTLVAAVTIAALWRSPATYEIKAAALGAGVLLATPYLYIYDLVALAVPLAFLWRLGRARGFLKHEMIGIGVICALVLIFPFVKVPVGFAATLLVAALIARRALSPTHAGGLTAAAQA